MRMLQRNLRDNFFIKKGALTAPLKERSEVAPLLGSRILGRHGLANQPHASALFLAYAATLDRPPIPPPPRGTV